MVHQTGIAFSYPDAKQVITTRLDKLDDFFAQRDRSCSDFTLSQVKGFAGPTGMIAVEKRSHHEIQKRGSKPDRQVGDLGTASHGSARDKDAEVPWIEALFRAGLNRNTKAL